MLMNKGMGYEPTIFGDTAGAFAKAFTTYKDLFTLVVQLTCVCKGRASAADEFVRNTEAMLDDVWRTIEGPFKGTLFETDTAEGARARLLALLNDMFNCNRERIRDTTPHMLEPKAKAAAAVEREMLRHARGIARRKAEAKAGATQKHGAAEAAGSGSGAASSGDSGSGSGNSGNGGGSAKRHKRAPRVDLSGLGDKCRHGSKGQCPRAKSGEVCRYKHTDDA